MSMIPDPDLALTARIARPSDREKVTRLCMRASGSRDYVLSIMKEVLADRGLFLAWSRGELVGMVNFDESIDGSGWLSMGRTDPDWRRLGVATFLQEQVAAYARRKGIDYLRLWTLSNNKSSMVVVTKAGFRPVCEATHVTGTVRRRRTTPRAASPRSGYPGSHKFLLKSSFLSKTNGYFAYKWYFVRASEALLKTLFDNGELHVRGRSVFVLTKPEISFGNRRSSFALIQGSATSALPEIKLATGYRPLFLGSYIPYDNYLLAVARKNGFKRDSWAKHCVVFEKKN